MTTPQLISSRSVSSGEAFHFPAWWPADIGEVKPAEGAGLWDTLKSALEVQQSIPTPAGGIISKEMSDGSGHHFLLKNPRTHSYVRLSPEEFWVWQTMNGVKTVQQLVFAYFMKYKAFAFTAILSLVERLREAYMLSEAPRHLYAEVSTAIQGQSLTYKLTWFARVAMTKEFVIKRLDSRMEDIHRFGGWILFTWPVQIIFLLVSILGLYFFFLLIRDPRFQLIELDAAIQLGLLAYVPLVIHEFGHAITAKHCGAEVYKGGVMLYYGLPAAFVDTTDLWMFRKRARLAVTWAGPYTGYILGGVSSMIVFLFPGLPQATLLLQLAMVSFLTSTLNLLPLLKLDGYYLLSDALEIPRLRERSMEFLTRQLRGKIGKGEKWTREEKIFLVFGVLAFLSTFYFTFEGVAFWDRQATKSIAELFNLQGNFIGLALNVGIILLAVSTVLYSLILLADSARRLVPWLRNKGIFSTRGRAASIIVLGALTLTLLPRPLLPTLSGWLLFFIGVVSFAFAAWLAASTYNSMRGSVHAWMWLPAAIGLLAGALGFAGQVNADWTGAGLGLQAAGIILLLFSFVLVGRLWRGLSGSWRHASLALIVLGFLIWIVSIFSLLEMRILAGLLILGGLVHWRMRPATQIKVMDLETTVSTRQKLVRTFDAMKTTILSELELDFGVQTRAWVEAGVYRSKQDSVGKAGFTTTQTFMTPGDYGGALALMLDETLAGVERAAGSQYAKRSLAYSFDQLDWELQESAEDYILKYVGFAAGLSNELSATRNDLDAFLRSVPMFVGLSEAELRVLGKQFKPQRFQRNQVIVQAGEVGDSFYILRMGRAVVLSSSGERLNNLGRADYFGEASLLVNQKRNATIRALTPVEVLRLSKSHFDRLIRSNIQFDERARMEFQRLGVLRQIPLFAQFEGFELKMLAKRMKSVEVPAGREIFKQGEPGIFFTSSNREK